MKALTLFVWWFISVVALGFESDQPRSEKATLILYRQREYGAFSYVIHLNNERLGVLTTNRYIQVEIPAGHNSIQAKKSYIVTNKKVVFEAKPGVTYYVKAVDDFDYLGRSLLFGFVSEEQAKRELSRIKPMEPYEKDPNDE
jgi:hypothetical protein